MASLCHYLGLPHKVAQAVHCTSSREPFTWMTMRMLPTGTVYYRDAHTNFPSHSLQCSAQSWAHTWLRDHSLTMYRGWRAGAGPPETLSHLSNHSHSSHPGPPPLDQFVLQPFFLSLLSDLLPTRATIRGSPTSTAPKSFQGH